MKLTYYTFEEVIKFVEAWFPEYDTGKTVAIADPEQGTLTMGITEFIIKSGIDSEYITSVINAPKSNELWCKYIVPRYRKLYAIFTDSNELDDDLAKEVAIKFITILNNTYTKYSTLISNYETVKDHLLDNIKTISESKFNDTPQNIQDSTHSWTDDNYLTNISRTENSTELVTKISRLQEIEEKISDYYFEWSKEFWRMFIYE